MSADLEAARAAYERGDYAETRRRARAALAAAGSDSEKEEARLLLARVSNDRAVLILMGACLAFFAVVVLLFVGRG
jgi:hypothetical protein